MLCLHVVQSHYLYLNVRKRFPKVIIRIFRVRIKFFWVHPCLVDYSSGTDPSEKTFLFLGQNLESGLFFHYYSELINNCCVFRPVNTCICMVGKNYKAWKSLKWNVTPLIRDFGGRVWICSFLEPSFPLGAPLSLCYFYTVCWCTVLLALFICTRVYLKP